MALLALLAAGPLRPAVADLGPLEVLTRGSDSIYGGEAWGLSADGRHALLWTPMDWSADEIPDGDAEDMYLWDRVQETWTWVSPPVEAGDDPGALIPGGVMSEDASTVAYAEQRADGLFALTVTDVATRTAARHGAMREDFPTVSGDGVFVGFGQVLDVAQPEVTYASVLDRRTGETIVHGPAGSRVSAISRDGSTMLYQVATSTFFHDWVVVDLRSGDQTPVPAPTPAGLRDTSGVLTADGTTSIHVGVEDSGRTVVVHDVESGTITTVLTGLDNPFVTDVSPDGDRILLTDGAALLPEDTNDAVDAYLLDVPSGQRTRVSTAADGREAAGGIERLGTFLADDGVTATFTSVARDLVADPDLPPFFNAFVKRVDGLDPLTSPTVPEPVGAPVLDGDPATTELLGSTDPVDAAVAMSVTRFDDGAAPYAVLTRVDEFADALAGTGLSAGPLLLTDGGALSPAVEGEIGRAVRDDGVVYLLGGEAAIGAAVESALVADGYDVRRLAGATRVETALAVADVVAPDGTADVLLARSTAAGPDPTAAWADSLPAGVVAATTGRPLLLTPTAALHPAVADWLATRGVVTTTLYGGADALSTAVADAVPGPVRVAGSTRAGTAATIAMTPPLEAAGRFVIVQGAALDGWAYGLPAAGFAADGVADGPVPILLVGDVVPPETAALVSACGAAAVDLLVIGGASVVGSEVVAELDRMDGDACA